MTSLSLLDPAMATRAIADPDAGRTLSQRAHARLYKQEPPYEGASVVVGDRHRIQMAYRYRRSEIWSERLGGVVKSLVAIAPAE